MNKTKHLFLFCGTFSSSRHKNAFFHLLFFYFLFPSQREKQNRLIWSYVCGLKDGEKKRLRGDKDTENGQISRLKWKMKWEKEYRKPEKHDNNLIWLRIVSSMRACCACMIAHYVMQLCTVQKCAAHTGGSISFRTAGAWASKSCSHMHLKEFWTISYSHRIADKTIQNINKNRNHLIVATSFHALRAKRKKVE